MSEKRILEATNYLNIQGWMVTKLHLKGSQLLIYAVIYGFSQDGEGWFHGSRAYLAEWCSSDLGTVTRNLSKMVEDGLLLRDDRNESSGLCNRYRVNPACLEFLYPQEQDEKSAASEVQRKKEIEEAEGQENRKLENQKDVRQLNEMSHAFCDHYKGVGKMPTPLPEDKKSFAPEAQNTGGWHFAKGGMAFCQGGSGILPHDNKDNNKAISNSLSLFSSIPEEKNGIDPKPKFYEVPGTDDEGSCKLKNASLQKNEEEYRELLRTLPATAISPVEKQKRLTEALKSVIGYEQLRASHQSDLEGLNLLKDIVGTLIHEVYLCQSGTIRFGRRENDTRLVQTEFSHLTGEQVESVLENLKQIEKEPRNVVSYLLTSLYRSLHSQTYQKAARKYSEEKGRQPPLNQFKNFTPREYDYKQLEQELFQAQILGEGEELP